MTGARRHWLRGAVTAAALALLSLPAFAGGPPSDALNTSGGLVRGNAPLPEFYLDFPSISNTLRPPLVSDDSLEISLTSSDNKVLQFLFSPRPQFGTTLDKSTGTSRSYGALTWTMFNSSGLFGNIGVAGSYTDSSFEDPDRRLLGPPVAMHGMLEFGYQMGDQHSLSLSLDHSSTLDLGNDHGLLGDNLRLRYGYKF
jgi:hypothetical protein